METLALFIFGIGWPVLIAGSVWLWGKMDRLSHTSKSLLNVALIGFYLLGYVSTVFWLGQPWYIGVFPAFVLFIVLFVITFRTVLMAGKVGHEDREAHA
jgi:hypothetical protein